VVVRKILLNNILFLLLVINAFDGFSQEIIRKSYFFEKNLNYESFPEDSPGSRIISSLASNNITALYWVSINVQADLLVQLNKAEFGQLSANIILHGFQLDGETFFRDFAIDSLLMPDLIEGNLNIYYRNKLLVTQPWLLAVRTGHIHMFVPDTVHFNEKKLRIELEVSRFNYSNDRFKAFQQTTNLINSYYAFSTVLDEMLEYYHKNGLNHDQNPAYLYIAWEEIQRVNNYVYKYQFFNHLNLDTYDPAGFISYYDKSIRLQRRANTLKSWINRKSAISIIEEKQAFCQGFANLSKKYLDLAGNHQPYIAAGFSEVARICSNEQVKDMLLEAGNVFDVFNKVDSVNTVQTIYNHFVELAAGTMANQRYVVTLDLLYNANLMTEWFESVDRSEKYDRIYVNAIDGLMSAYLKVATMAYRSETFYMAEIYYQKAMDVYELHSGNLRGTKLASDAFLAFIEQQTELSYKMIEDEEYFKAIILLNKAQEISEAQQILQNKSRIDSAYRLSYVGIYDKKLDSIQQLLDNHQPDEALLAMAKTSAFSKQKNQYLQNVNQLHFTVLAEALFDNYYRQGETLMNGKNADKALFAFLKAKTINEKYMDQPDEQLDSLIYSATVPVILDIIEKAEFEVWANRMQNAQNLLDEATEIQTKYQQQNNKEVIAAINGLSIKIKNRHCTNLSYHCFEIEKKAENRIASKKYVEAEDLLITGKRIISENPDCNIRSEKINSLYSQNEDVFAYYAYAEKISNNLKSQNYQTVVVDLIALNEMYHSGNIKRFGIEEPDIYRFIKSRRNVGLNFAASEYLTETGSHKEAFKYLKLLKQLNVQARETKVLQQSIGKGLISDNTPVDRWNKELMKAIDGTDKWYKYLKKSYQNKSGKFLNIFTKK